MRKRARSIVILSIVFGYILLQFLWWEILLVRQNAAIIAEKQKLVALEYADLNRIQEEILVLQHKKTMQTVMIVSEGTVFLLLLLFGLYKIKQAIDKERELVNQQKNFFLSITHELKTPIAATKLQLQTLLRAGIDVPTSQVLIHSALEETERLNKLINNVLFASRLESEQFVIHPELTDVSEFIRDLAERYFAEAIRTGQLQIQTARFPQLTIDRMSLHSIMSNLIENALKYSNVPAEVIVRTIQDGNSLIIEVKDQGIGISEQDKPKIFERFYRAGDEETRRTKGTGLGLYIVKFLVEQNGGKLKLSNNEPQGSIFEIRFPLS